MNELLGYYEEYWEETGSGYSKCLGMRRLQTANVNLSRQLGPQGREEVTLTEPLLLIKGHRFIPVKASAKRPRKCFTMLQKLEGKAL